PVQPPAAGPPAAGGPLAVTSAHAGSFAQGDAADRYTLTVGNTSSKPTQGTVTVVDTLPTGITGTRLTGDGWTCSLQPATLPGPSNTFEQLLTCSRSDPLAAGAAYPPITLSVAVANDARPTLTNTVTASGGGATPASATATDPTTVVQK